MPGGLELNDCLCGNAVLRLEHSQERGTTVKRILCLWCGRYGAIGYNDDAAAWFWNSQGPIKAA